MNAARELIELIEIEEAPLRGSLTGAGEGFMSTVPAGGDGDSSPAGAGAGEGEPVLVWLLLSASTITNNFSFLRQRSLLPLTK